MATEVAPLPGAVAGATFHPDDVDLAALVRRAFDELGLRVAKLHCSVGDFAADDPRLEPLWLAAAARGVPVVVHAGHDANGRTAVHELAPIAAVATAHPDCRLVIAHCAAPHLDDALTLLAAHPALYADLTGTAQWRVPLPVAAVTRLADRLLFGSDCPNTPVTITESAAWIRAAGFDDRTLAAIFAGTARRLIP